MTFGTRGTAGECNSELIAVIVLCPILGPPTFPRSTWCPPPLSPIAPVQVLAVGQGGLRVRGSQLCKCFQLLCDWNWVLLFDQTPRQAPASVVLGSCRGRKNVSMTLKIWRFVIWTTEWKLSRWYSLWSSNYATPSLPRIPPQNPNPLLLFLSRNEAVKLLCPLWIIFRVGVMALCPAALHLLCFPSSLRHGCTVLCLAHMPTWGANIQGIQV